MLGNQNKVLSASQEKLYVHPNFYFLWENAYLDSHENNNLKILMSLSCISDLWEGIKEQKNSELYRVGKNIVMYSLYYWSQESTVSYTDLF